MNRKLVYNFIVPFVGILTFILSLLFWRTSIGEEYPSKQVQSKTIIAIRDILPKPTLKERIHIEIKIIVPAMTTINGFILKEIVPKGYNIVSSIPAPQNYDSETGEVKWLFLGSDAKSRNIIYYLKKKPKQECSNNFEGEILYKSGQKHIRQKIKGDSTF